MMPEPETVLRTIAAGLPEPEAVLRTTDEAVQYIDEALPGLATALKGHRRGPARPDAVARALASPCGPKATVEALPEHAALLRTSGEALRAIDDAPPGPAAALWGHWRGLQGAEQS